MNGGNVYKGIEKHRFLLEKYFNGTIEPEERRQLAVWLWSDRRNRELLLRLRNSKLLRQRFRMYDEFDVDREFELLTHRYQVRQKRKLVARWCSSVAVIALIVGTMIFFDRIGELSHWDTIALEEKVQAVLTTADGYVIPLKEKMIESGVQDFQIYDSLKELVCNQSDVHGDSSSYHKLEVPRGGEYTLVLADGTYVRLNSESSIRFPGSFSGTLREVEIHGEAYLEVRKDSLPFVVHANEMKIEVLGTRFGVRVYRDETMASTTLAEGRVRVVAGKSDMVLIPGEQAYLTDGKLRKRKVDVDKCLAWVNGLFVFEHDDLSYVVNQLTRWYNMRFEFANDQLKGYKFTGTVGRDEGLEGIINLMKKMNVVSFEKKDGYYLIKENDKVKMYN